MRKTWLVVGALSLAGVGAWRVHHHHSDASITSDTTGTTAATGAKLVQDRIWIDHLPRNERDTVNAFLAISSESIGVFHSGSAWHGQFDMFRYEAHGNQLRAVFPQTGDREQLRTGARECDDSGFDFCLEIKGSQHGVARYYSMKGWEIESRSAGEALVHKLELGAAK
jgi:hypothetical protein